MPETSKLEIKDLLVPESWNKEPALKVGVSTTAVAALLSVLHKMFPNVFTPNVIELITVLGVIFLPLITAYLIRRKAWSPHSVQEMQNKAMLYYEDKYNERWEEWLKKNANVPEK